MGNLISGDRRKQQKKLAIIFSSEKYSQHSMWDQLFMLVKTSKGTITILSLTLTGTLNSETNNTHKTNEAQTSKHANSCQLMPPFFFK